MNTTRVQHSIPAAIVLVLSIWVAWISFTQQPAGAFLFPRLISIFLVMLAVWNFIRAIFGLSKIGEGFSRQTLLNILPGMAVAVIYVFVLAKLLGFYTASFITFFILYTLYDPAPFSSPRDWIKRLMTTIVFMAVIYTLFAVILQVQTPRGFFV